MSSYYTNDTSCINLICHLNLLSQQVLTLQWINVELTLADCFNVTSQFNFSILLICGVIYTHIWHANNQNSISWDIFLDALSSEFLHACISQPYSSMHKVMEYTVYKLNKAIDLCPTVTLIGTPTQDILTCH